MTKLSKDRKNQGGKDRVYIFYIMLRLWRLSSVLFGTDLFFLFYVFSFVEIDAGELENIKDTIVKDTRDRWL